VGRPVDCIAVATTMPVPKLNETLMFWGLAEIPNFQRERFGTRGALRRSCTVVRNGTGKARAGGWVSPARPCCRTEFRAAERYAAAPVLS
jgi:hypothetical protein